LERKAKTDHLALPAILVDLVIRETRGPRAGTDHPVQREREARTVCRENVARLDHEGLEDELEDLEVSASLDRRVTLASRGLLDRWVSRESLDLKAREDHRVRLDCLEYLERMDQQDRQESEDHLESTVLLAHKETQELLVHQDQLVRLDH